jgi:hypothetical protein
MNDSDQYEQIDLRLFLVSPPVPLRKTSTAAASWGTAAASTDRLSEQHIQLVV